MKKHCIIFFIFFLLSKTSFAYVDVERAEFLHFLSSRFLQVYMPGKFVQYSGKTGNFIESRIKPEAGRKFWNKHGKEYFPHQGWRLGCNIGWEIAGAGLMYLDHRSVNWITMLKDSVSPLGLLLYPIGQVIGQSYLEMEVFEKQFAKSKFLSRPLGKYLSPVLVERMGSPWQNATMGNAASRFLGLGIGTYLSWSLFDLGHNLVFKKRLDFSVFNWNAHKALAMAGFTYGGYIGHNIGYKLSEKLFSVADQGAAFKDKGIMQRALSSKLYNNFASKAEGHLERLSVRMSRMGKLNPAKGALKLYSGITKRIINRNALLSKLSKINHGYTAAPVNALFCFILADNLPKILTAIEEWLLISEYEQMEEPIDIFEAYKNIEDEDKKLAFVDEILAGANKHIEDSLQSISDLMLDEKNFPEGISPEERAALLKKTEDLKSMKGILFDNSLMAGILTESILDEVASDIDSIEDTSDLRNFIIEDFAPVFGAEDYKTILANDIEESLDSGNTELGKIKDSLKIYTEFGLPPIINANIEQSILAADDDADFSMHVIEEFFN